MAERIVVTSILLAGLALLVPLHTSAQSSGDDWKFSIAPYLWFPSLDGDLNSVPPRSGGSSPKISIDDRSISGDINFAGLMLSGMARKGKWVIGTDVIYLDFDGEKRTVGTADFDLGSGPINIFTADLNAETDTSLTSWHWALTGGYTVVQKPKLNLDVIGGFRYLGLDKETKWQLTGTVTGPDGNTVTVPRNGKVKRSEDIWTGIIGTRGYYRLGEGGWFTNFYADIGGGSSTFTWQGMAGIGYAFHWGNIQLDYRYMYYDQDDDELIDNLSYGGPALGVDFRF